VTLILVLAFMSDILLGLTLAFNELLLLEELSNDDESRRYPSS
jgi:hypothetical protein